MPKIEISISDEGESKEKNGSASKGKFGKSKGKFEDKPADQKMSSEVSDKMKNKDHYAPHLDHPQVKSAYPGDKITGSK